MLINYDSKNFSGLTLSTSITMLADMFWHDIFLNLVLRLRDMESRHSSELNLIF